MAGRKETKVRESGYGFCRRDYKSKGKGKSVGLVELLEWN